MHAEPGERGVDDVEGVAAGGAGGALEAGLVVALTDELLALDVFVVAGADQLAALAGFPAAFADADAAFARLVVGRCDQHALAAGAPAAAVAIADLTVFPHIRHPDAV